VVLLRGAGGRAEVLLASERGTDKLRLLGTCRGADDGEGPAATAARALRECTARTISEGLLAHMAARMRATGPLWLEEHAQVVLGLALEAAGLSPEQVAELGALPQAYAERVRQGKGRPVGVIGALYWVPVADLPWLQKVAQTSGEHAQHVPDSIGQSTDVELYHQGGSTACWGTTWPRCGCGGWGRRTSGCGPKQRGRGGRGGGRGMSVVSVAARLQVCARPAGGAHARGARL
jgi:hypothetical protein